MSRHRSGVKKVPPEIGLHMECVEEDLEPCQILHYKKAETEYTEIQNKLDHLINKMKAEIVEKGENCLVLQLNVTPSNNIGNTSQVSQASSGGKVARQSGQNYQQVVGQGLLTRSGTNAPGNTYLVMDPRLGLVVGQVPATENTSTSPTKPASGPRTRSNQGSVTVTTRARSNVKKPSSASEPEIVASPITRMRDKVKNTQIQQPTSPPSSQAIQQVYSSGSTSNNPGSYRIKIHAKQLPPPSKPSENNAVGGLTAGSKTQWKPNSDEGAKGNTADSREVTFNKMSGKTFPSLVVAARPHLRLKYIPQSNISQERTALDIKVKGVLMYTPTKFTEWLIQQGLIRSEQICQLHVNNDLSPVKLKLGMYSDVSKFPYSGGYVWISECCPSQFVSVFSGSIFEGAPHSPTTLLKLIYHWACQTNVQNVVQWVKVDNLYVKNFFTNMRAVCTQAIHQKHQKLGGAHSKVEVGVISLGTTSQDGNMRQVKVEVLGVMDPESKLIRLRALEPLAEERNFKRRFAKILEPLEEWVYKESTIFTDFTVDKGTLISMGFRTVYQTSVNDESSHKYSNQNVMEYLRRVMPRMFQNTLSLLSRQIIQQFLDELVWREMWGPIPSQAFVNIIAHIAEQTKLDVTDSLLFRLNKVASNPFKNWNYSVWKPITASYSNTRAQQPTSIESSESSTVLKSNRGRKRTADVVTTDISPPAKKNNKLVVKDKVKKDEKVKLLDKIPKKEKDKETPQKESTPIKEEIVSFINDTPNQIPLDSHYYGTIEGDAEIISGEYKGAFLERCSVCNIRFDNNVTLMKHMILHAQQTPFLTVDLNSVHQCEYCFRGYNSSVELKDHMNEAHSTYADNKSSDIFDCKICEEIFKNRVELIYHMHRTHVEMEIPYECGICFFRTSIYKSLIDHFLQIHKGGEHVMCPYCLKVVTFSYKGKSIPRNIRFYENHLEKHGRTSLIKKCFRCNLSFIHKGIFEQHLEADHRSFKCEYGAKPFVSSSDTILMPLPGDLIKPILSSNKGMKYSKNKPIYITNKFKTLETECFEADMACIECEGSLLKLDHFTANFICLKCRYATCCENAIIEHVTIFHDSPTPQFSFGKPVVLNNGMFCKCGYSTYSGNKLAKHIVLCGMNTAYPSEEAAYAAVLLEEKSPSRSAEPGEGQNMLNMLGLVRKSPELGMATSETLKKENSVENTEDEENEEEFGICNGQKVDDVVKDDSGQGGNERVLNTEVVAKDEEFHSAQESTATDTKESGEKSSVLTLIEGYSEENNESVAESITSEILDLENTQYREQNEKKTEISVKDENACGEDSNNASIEDRKILEKNGDTDAKSLKEEPECDSNIRPIESNDGCDVNISSAERDPLNKGVADVEAELHNQIELEVNEVKLEDNEQNIGVENMDLDENHEQLTSNVTDNIEILSEKVTDFCNDKDKNTETQKIDFIQSYEISRECVPEKMDVESHSVMNEEIAGGSKNEDSSLEQVLNENNPSDSVNSGTSLTEMKDSMTDMPEPRGEQ